MGNFSIDIKTVLDAQKTLAHCAGSIREDAKDIRDVADRLKAFANIEGNIHKSIENIANDCGIYSFNIFQAEKILRTVINCYSAAEKRILNWENIINSGMDTQIYSNDVSSNDITLLNDENITSVTTPLGTTYKIGKPERPEWEAYKQYDNDFPYNPDMEPTENDKNNWVKYGILEQGAKYAGWLVGRNMPDAVETYQHYRDNTGTDFEVDFSKAYKQDKGVKASVDNAVNDAKKAVDVMIQNGKKPPFCITGDLIACSDDPQTENWQKAIGAFNIWVSAEVMEDENGVIHMTTTVHELDRYNFNSGQQDIVSHSKDEDNGRFEQLGWAKSFTTYGKVDF